MRKGFTLAETLITIGMIGVIAALTLPTLMNSTNEKEIIAKVKKTYAMLSEAIARYIATYGPIDNYVNSNPEKLGSMISQFLNVEQEYSAG